MMLLTLNDIKINSPSFAMSLAYEFLIRVKHRLQTLQIDNLTYWFQLYFRLFENPKQPGWVDLVKQKTCLTTEMLKKLNN